jgi:diguanylate cyclase (GGDEF)-like protein
MWQPLLNPFSWLPAVAILLLLGVIILLQRRRVRGLAERNRQLQQLLEERSKQIEKSTRTRRDEAVGDDLTGIANHRSFQEALRLQWRRTARSRLPLTVLMFDVDGLKHYNEAKGHQAGDECLRQVAEALHQQLQRPGDLVARYGGDEFAVLLAETDASGGVAVAEKMRQSVADMGLAWGPNTESQRITVSGGVATTVPSPQEHPTSLIAAADRALAVAKRNGRNRVEM